MRKKELVKRIQAVILSAAMMVTLIPTTSFAAEEPLPEVAVEETAEPEDEQPEEPQQEEQGQEEPVQEAPEETEIPDSSSVPAESGEADLLFSDEPVTEGTETQDNTAAQALADAFDNNVYTLRPNYQNVKNINDLVKAKIVEQSGVNADEVTVSTKSSDDPDTIAQDGAINYVTMDELNAYTFSKNVSCSFEISYQGGTAVTDSHTVTVGWDQEFFKQKMQGEADTLTEQQILNGNPSAAEVTSDLTLPQIMGSSARNVWSQIVWTSSDPSVIELQDTEWGALTNPKKGKVTRPQQDTVVRLTAEFKANDTILNDYAEKPEDFGTITKTFDVTVKADEKKVPTVEELEQLIRECYLNENNSEAVTRGGIHYYAGDQALVKDGESLKGDLQLPRYTRIKKDGELVFANKEITVTSSNPDVLKVNGYRAAVNFLQQEDQQVTLSITITRDGVSATVPVTYTVKKIDTADLDAEAELLQYVKAHMFDGLKGENSKPEKITKALNTFLEFYRNDQGEDIWVHDVNDKTDEGIIPDGYFDDSWEMEGAGYNKFKSSNTSVVAHESLQITAPSEPTEVTVTAWLSSEKYGAFLKYAEEDSPFYPYKEKLYKVPAEVTMTIMPEGTEDQDVLNVSLEAAQKFLDSIQDKIGDNAGQYPKAAADALEQAIGNAKKVSEDTNADDQTRQKAADTLNKAVQTCKDAQRVEEIQMTLTAGLVSNQTGEDYSLKVSGDLAREYGYDIKDEYYAAKVTVLDALVAAHAQRYGDAFKKNPKQYLELTADGFITRLFGEKTMSIGFLVNNRMPVDPDEPTMGSTAKDTVLKSSDHVSVFIYRDEENYRDLYLYFDKDEVTLDGGGTAAFTLMGYHPVDSKEKSVPQAGYQVRMEGPNGSKTAVTDANGKVTFQAGTAGVYTVSVTGKPQASKDEFVIYPSAAKVTVNTVAANKISIPAIGERTDLSKLALRYGTRTLKQGTDYTVSRSAKGHAVTVTFTFKGAFTGKRTSTYTTAHRFSKWRTAARRTVFAPEKREYTCSVCGKRETRYYGSKLTAYAKANVSTLPLKVKQSTTQVRISYAYGDSVRSWKSSNTRIAKVSSKGKITAQKKTGTARITVTLKSGKTTSFKVKVQKSNVKTKKLTGMPSKLKLSKGKSYTLKPKRNPFTSKEKVTYSSSNKKIVTVSSKGKIRAKKAGKAKITIRAGKAKYRVTVTVPKTATKKILKVPTKKTIKKGRTYTLKPKLSPKSSDYKITYSSSNKKVATVDSKGKIRAKRKGKATIRVKSGKITVTCKITVK